MIFTVNDIKKSAVASINTHLFEVKKKSKIVKPRNDCPQVVEMHWWLKYFCEEKGLRFEKEYKFSTRKYRADFAIPEHKILIEYDGLNSKKSGHTTLVGFTSDTEKINLAITLGWRVLRFTCLNYENVLTEIKKLI